MNDNEIDQWFQNHLEEYPEDLKAATDLERWREQIAALRERYQCNRVQRYQGVYK